MKKYSLPIFGFLFFLNSVWAEVYLSPDEALKLCLPRAQEIKKIEFPIDGDLKARILKKLNSKNLPMNSVAVFVGTKGKETTGYLIPGRVVGKHEPIDFVVAFDLEKKIRQVEILAYRESHGGEVRRESWRKQFVGKSADDDISLHHSIANISGATLSARHLTEDIRRIATIFSELKL